MKVWQMKSVRTSHAALCGLVLVSVAVTLSFAADGPQKKPAGKPAKNRKLTLAEAMAASQGKRQIQFYKDNGERGVLQQQVFDLVREQGELQIALVVDGTNSMGQDLDSLKAGLKDFIAKVRSVRPGAMTEVAIVIYRDYGCASGPVTIATPKNSKGEGIFLGADGSELADVIDNIKTDDGTPRFAEQVDQGVYTAITQLNWSTESDAARSIILAGDAPPFAEGEVHKRSDGFNSFMEKYAVNDSIPLRKHTIEGLIAAANDRKISIFSILCNAGFVDADAADAREVARIAQLLRPDMQSFAWQLASGTGGKVLDLSDPQLVAELVNNADGLEPRTQLNPVVEQELETRIKNSSVVMRVAVLPSVPMAVLREGTDGWPKTAGYTYACALVNRLNDIDSRGVINMSPLLWDKFSLVNLRAAKDAPDQEILKELASPNSLDLDFILWGEFTAPDRHEVVLRAFDRNGHEVAKTLVEGTSLVGMVAPSLTKLSEQLVSVKTSDADAQHRAIAFSKLLAAPGLKMQDEGWEESLLESYRLIEEASAYELGNPKGQEFNQQAVEILDGYLKMRPNSAFAYLLRSSCHRNLGHKEEANSDLEQAKEHSSQMADDPLSLEIAADYLLFVKNDPFGAVAKYEDLVLKNEQANRIYCKQALRAKWMLSGLYLGGWGFAKTEQFKEEERKYLDKARELLLDVLVYWPESPEAEYYERYVEPRPVRAPRRVANKKVIGFNFPLQLNPPKNGGRVAMNYDEDGSAPGT